MLSVIRYGLSEPPVDKGCEYAKPQTSPIIEDTPERAAQTETSHEEEEEKKTYKWDLVWWNIILLGTLHIAAVYGYFFKFSHPGANTLAKVIAFASTLGITGGAHRLWTHKSYKANNTAQLILMFMATLTYQNSIYVWARDHRVHHKFAETDADPHNAKRGFFFCHMGWLMVRKHPDVIEKGKTVDMSDLEANPIVMFQHKYYYPLVFLIAAVFPTCLAHYTFGIPWDVAIFHVTIYRYIVSVNLVWCINSVAHIFGNKPYDKNIGATESSMMRIFGFGEGFHNYHHAFPYDYKAAEFHNDTRNLTTFLIDFFAWLGWVTDRKTVPKELVDRKVARSGGGKREENMYSTKFKIYRNLKSLLLILLITAIG